MNCPYCNGEMELGKMELISRPSGYITSEFIPQSELRKNLRNKIVDAIQEICAGEVSSGKKISMKDFQQAYYCPSCRRAFAEFIER